MSQVRGVTHDASQTESAGQNVENPSSSATKDASPAQPTAEVSATPTAGNAQGESGAETVITTAPRNPPSKKSKFMPRSAPQSQSITGGFLSRLSDVVTSETSNGDAVDNVWKDIMKQEPGEVTFGPPKRRSKGFAPKGVKWTKKATNPRRPQAQFDMPGTGMRDGPPTHGGGPTWSSEEWRNAEAEILKDQPDLITKPKALRELILNTLEEKMESVDVSVAARMAAANRQRDLPPHLRLDGRRRDDLHVMDNKSVSREWCNHAHQFGPNIYAELQHKFGGRELEQVSDDELIGTLDMATYLGLTLL